MPQLSFHPGYHWAALLLTAAAAAAVVGLCYRRVFAHVTPGQWRLMFGLRMTAIAFILLLLFRPVLSFQTQLTERRAVVLLLDQSASMSIADGPTGGARFELARAAVMNGGQKLAADFDVRLALFAENAAGQDNLAAAANAAPTGPATSLSRALAAAGKLAPRDRAEAVILVSDGIHNAAGDPGEPIEQLGAPLHVIGVGNTLRDGHAHRDARVTGVESLENLAVGNRARVRAFVDAAGLGGRVTRVLLQEDGQTVAEHELVLDDAPGPQEAPLEFTPSVKGLHLYTVLVPPAAEEKITQNNQRSISAAVQDARMRVLYVEGGLRPEYGALVGRFLAKDPNVEYCALVQTRPNVFMQRANIADLNLTGLPADPELLKSFKVFIIGDLDSSHLRPQQFEQIRALVEEGAGLLLLGGYHGLGPGGYGATPWAEILPAELGDRDIGQVNEPFVPMLTPEGRQHPVFANIAKFFPTASQVAELADLPPLEGCARVRALRPGATLLAAHPSEKCDSGPLPVLATRPVGKGRAVVFTGDTTRNWHQVLRAADQETPFLRFWGQMIRFLAGRDEAFPTGAGLVATTDRAYYEPGATIKISARAQGAEGEALANLRVNARVSGPDNRAYQFQLPPRAGPSGNYEHEFEPASSGKYEIRVNAQLGGQPLQAPPLTVEVGRPNLEFDRLEPDVATLQALAQRGGGQYHHVSTADRLFEQLRRKLEKRLVQYELPLHYPPLFWALFVAALTGEWWLRRSQRLR